MEPKIENKKKERKQNKNIIQKEKEIKPKKKSLKNKAKRK